MNVTFTDFSELENGFDFMHTSIIIGTESTRYSIDCVQDMIADARTSAEHYSNEPRQHYSNQPCHEKTCLRGLRLGKTQIDLRSHRS